MKAHKTGSPSFPCPTLLLLAFVLLPLLATGTVYAEEQGPEADQQVQVGAKNHSLAQAFDEALGQFNSLIAEALFFNIAGDTFQVEEAPHDRETNTPAKMKTVPVPFVVALLALSGIAFTVAYRFVNLRGFRHAIAIVRGKYDSDANDGEISHFRALTSALSATVGLGNIAGVAIAIKLGGPGAVFWMIVTAFFGMSTKFSSCSLAQLYRKHNQDGSVSGGPMYYLDLGLKNRGGVLAKVGKTLAITYAFMIMGGSMGGGNMFQANQAFETLRSAFPSIKASHSIGFGLILATLVALVILGGIKRIGAATSKIVPLMVGTYVIAALAVLGANAAQVPDAFALIFERAFSKNAVFGGSMGVLVWGVQRASFSNEAGLGSSAIAHAAAKTDQPVREGLVAMLEPFIDTVIVCTMTALVVIVSGVWQDPNLPNQGAALTSAAFATVIPWFPVVLSFCVLLFAYSTMISWCYYGERGWIYLMDHFGLGTKTLPVFRIIFVAFVFIGSVANLGAVLDFSDMLILCMALPNVVGSMLMIPLLRKNERTYFEQLEPPPPATSR